MVKSLAPDLAKPCFLYRFEIYIPVTDNDGELIPPAKFDRLTEKLTTLFGGVSTNYPYGGSGGIDGMWYSTITQLLHRDHSAVIMVLAKDDNDSINFFKTNLKKWEKEFKQEKILIVFHRVQTF